jgi:hypothetical protein
MPREFSTASWTASSTAISSPKRPARWPSRLPPKAAARCGKLLHLHAS